jgi:hypothetical protein
MWTSHPSECLAGAVITPFVLPLSRGKFTVALNGLQPPDGSGNYPSFVTRTAGFYGELTVLDWVSSVITGDRSA